MFSSIYCNDNDDDMKKVLETKIPSTPTKLQPNRLENEKDEKVQNEPKDSLARFIQSTPRNKLVPNSKSFDTTGTVVSFNNQLYFNNDEQQQQQQEEQHQEELQRETAYLTAKLATAAATRRTASRRITT
uniref:Uncharacterized protein n=1 Tax=Ditylum brightwellii TaxID=49249 RepID=A0A7S4QTE9_9STRA